MPASGPVIPVSARIRAVREGAAGLLQQAYAADLDVVGQRLAHVVDRQCRDRSAGQCLHLHPGAVMNRDPATYRDLRAPDGGDLDLTVLEPERVAKRDQLVRA